MARPPRVEIPGALYHVIARGNQRRTIFKDPADYRRYIELLVRYQQRHGFTLYAYVLMPNHLHLLVSPGRLALSKTMQGLQQSYTRHYNQRHRLMGHCFQGRYKAILCQSDAYLLELVRYLHLNPVRAGLTPTADRYRWSSHRLYLEGRGGQGVAVEVVLRHYSSSRARAVAVYRTFVEAGLPVGHRQDLYEVVGQQFLGDDRFVERMEREGRHVASKPPVDISIEMITHHVARVFGVREIHLRGHGRSRSSALARGVVAYLAREEAGLTVTEVARYFARDTATLSVAVRRLEDRLAADPQLSAKVTQLRRVIRRGGRRRRSKQIIKA
jgi:REP element-mobilizing transposase RayT